MHRRCRVLRPTGFPPGGAGGEWVDLREKPTVRGEIPAARGGCGRRDGWLIGCPIARRDGMSEADAKISVLACRKNPLEVVGNLTPTRHRGCG